jgi:hypothetical protein
MADYNLEALEREGSKLADQVREHFLGLKFEGLTLDQVPTEEANGSNSLDEEFFKSLEAGEHLNERFLLRA